MTHDEIIELSQKYLLQLCKIKKIDLLTKETCKKLDKNMSFISFYFYKKKLSKLDQKRCELTRELNKISENLECIK